MLQSKLLQVKNSAYEFQPLLIARTLERHITGSEYQLINTILITCAIEKIRAKDQRLDFGKSRFSKSLHGKRPHERAKARLQQVHIFKRCACRKPARTFKGQTLVSPDFPKFCMANGRANIQRLEFWKFVLPFKKSRACARV